MQENQKFIIAFICCAFTTLTLADDTNASYQQAQDYIAKQGLSKKLPSSGAHVQDKLPGKGSHQAPKEKQYYEHPESIHNDANTNVATTGNPANTVINDAYTRTRWTINEKSPEIKFSKNIQEHANDIVTNNYHDCHKKAITKVHSMQKLCYTSRPYQVKCVKDLVASVEIQHPVVTMNIQGNVTRMWKTDHWAAPYYDSAAVHTSMPQGVITAVSVNVSDRGPGFPRGRRFQLQINGRTVASITPPSSTSQIIFKVNHLNIPFNNGIILNLSNLNDWSAWEHITGTITYTYARKTPVTHWDAASCTTLPKNCHPIKTECIAGASTKKIGMTNVSADCWQQVEINQCGGPASAQCRALKVQGCSLAARSCEKIDQGFCQQYKESWSCPTQETVGTTLQCGGQVYCIDGQCSPATDEKSVNAGKPLTELAAVAAAAADVKHQQTKTNNIRIFTGKAASCRDANLIGVNAMNCCDAGRGWAQGLYASCTAEENLIRTAKQEGRAFSLGRYCSNDVLGVCLEHHTGYCVFPSKIAYDVQIQGRGGQLHRGFGSGESPNCSGITPSEMQKINMDNIDFTNVKNNMMQQGNLPNSKKLQQLVTKQMQLMKQKEG